MQSFLYRREGRDGKTERRKVKEQSTNIPTKLLLGPMHPSQVQSRIPHTHTPHIAAYALPLMPLLYVCVCGCCPSASKAAGLLGQQSVHSLVKPALQALFLRTELLAEQKQMWAPSLLFLHLASASSPPQILSLTQKKPLGFQQKQMDQFPQLLHLCFYVTAKHCESRRNQMCAVAALSTMSSL